MDQKQKTEKKKRERLNDGNNKHAWHTQAAWAKIYAVFINDKFAFFYLL